MAYSGLLIKLGGSSGTELPKSYLKAETYKCVPNQRMDRNSTRDTTGTLHRHVLPHTATKIEVNTRSLTNTELATLNALLRSKMSDTQARTITLYYYDDETDTYKTGTFYMPDITYEKDWIDDDNNIIYYKSFRLAFIEH